MHDKVSLASYGNSNPNQRRKVPYKSKSDWYVVEDMMLKLGAGIAGIHHKGAAAALFLDGRRNFAQK